MNGSQICLNRPVGEIQKHLKFLTTTDRETINSALCALPGIGGAAVMLPNTDGTDSEINLEVLFDFAMKHQSALNGIFNKAVTQTPNTF